jgi:hypothetical protein
VGLTALLLGIFRRVPHPASGRGALLLAIYDTSSIREPSNVS